MSLRDKTACIASAALLLNLRLHLGSLWWIKPPTLVLCLREWCPIHKANRAMDLQPFGLHAQDLLGRRRHTLGRSLGWLGFDNEPLVEC